MPCFFDSKRIIKKVSSFKRMWLFSSDIRIQAIDKIC
nr:MAG TPA: hypothetical protein [Caudoviricetes sp.]